MRSAVLEKDISGDGDRRPFLLVDGGANGDNGADQSQGALGACYYDEIAHKYDCLFKDSRSRQENWIIGDLLSDHVFGKQVLDVGCGTGLLLEMLEVSPTNYMGIDPSEGMLREFWVKFPRHCTEGIGFEEADNWIGDSFLTISLFGSMNYVNPDYFNRVFDELKVGGYFLMFYKEGYSPVTYERAGGHGGRYETEAYDLIKADSIKTFGDYYLVHNLDLNYENI